MGKTRRKRLLRKSQQQSQALDHEKSLIELKKFMSRNGYTDEINLKLRNFPSTGRGVTSSKNLKENDVLIQVPYNLLITYNTIKCDLARVLLPESKLAMQDLLSIFLVLERHKTASFWKDYINSLPLEPPWLPSLLSEEHVKLLPADLRLAVEKSRSLLDESWSRVERSINSDWTCYCCNKKARCVLNRRSFVWGYILVNTRAVYVNPEIVRKQSTTYLGFLSDEPCMALCPFLDMFNHSDKAKTQAELISLNGQLVFQLATLSTCKKYEQIFISYGDHDNLRLLVDYGFFIVGNCYDCISFQLDEVLKITNLSRSDASYKFIKKHDLNKFLFINESSSSFNLKAVLYILSDDSNSNLASVIYSESYPQFFLEESLNLMCVKLLFSSLESMKQKVRILTSSAVNSLILEFVEYRCIFIERLIKLYE